MVCARIQAGDILVSFAARLDKVVAVLHLDLFQCFETIYAETRAHDLHTASTRLSKRLQCFVGIGS